MMREIRILSKLINNPNVVILFGYAQYDVSFIFLEFVQGLLQEHQRICINKMIQCLIFQSTLVIISQHH